MDPEVVKMSMLSSVEDKLKKRVNEVFEQGKVCLACYFRVFKVFHKPLLVEKIFYSLIENESGRVSTRDTFVAEYCCWG